MIRTATLTLRGAAFPPAPRRADSPVGFAVFYGGRRLRGSISSGAVDAIASAIQTQEGYYPGSLAYRNNNPGNLVYAGQPGASPGAGGFASFSSYDLGLQAMKNQIQLDADRGTDVNGNPTTTVAQLITSWAPPSQNNTAAYISSVAAQTGFDPTAPLSSLAAPDYSTAVDTTDGGALDLSMLTDSTVDLSAVGLSASTSMPLAIAAGLFGLLLISKL